MFQTLVALAFFCLNITIGEETIVRAMSLINKIINDWQIYLGMSTK